MEGYFVGLGFFLLCSCFLSLVWSIDQKPCKNWHKWVPRSFLIIFCIQCLFFWIFDLQINYRNDLHYYMLVYDRQTKEIIKPWIAGFWQEKTDGLLRVKVQSPKITINNGLIVRNIDYLLEVEVNPEFYFKNGQAREFNISYLILVAEITSALLNCNEENAPKLSDFYNPFDTEQLSRLSDLIIGYFNQPGVIDKRLRPIKVLSFNVS